MVYTLPLDSGTENISDVLLYTCICSGLLSTCLAGPAPLALSGGAAEATMAGAMPEVGEEVGPFMAPGSMSSLLLIYEIDWCTCNYHEHM